MKFREDDRGIEGLPMRLIIIVVIAVAVLATVLAMMKYITFEKPMTASCIKINGKDGFVVEVDATGSEEKTISFKATIEVKDSEGNPISGASVVLQGAHTTASGKTKEDGTVEINVQNAKLEENQQQVYMKILVKAHGYQDFEDDEGILIVRT